MKNNVLKKINSQVKKHINKQRRLVGKHKMLRFYQNTESNKVLIKYADKKWKFDYRPMSKYYSNTLKNVKHAYRKIQCKCSKRVIPKNGYPGQAVLYNGSIISIGCLEFKFICDSFEATQRKLFEKQIINQLEEGNLKAKENSQAQTESSREEDVPFTRQETYEDEGTSGKKNEEEVSINDSEETIKVFEEEISNSFADEVIDVCTKENTKLYVEDVSISNTEDVSVEETLASAKQDELLKNKQLVNGTYRKSRSDFPEFLALALGNVTIDGANSSIGDQEFFHQYFDNISDCQLLGNDLGINTVHNVMITNNNDDNSGGLILDDEGNDVSKLVNCNNPTLNDVQVNEPIDLPPSAQFWNDMNGMQSCFVDNMIQIHEESFSSGGENVEEEIVYEFDQSAEEQTDQVQELIEEIIVVQGENSVSLQPQLQAPQAESDVRGDFKTEHLYCARSPTCTSPPIIVISSDEDNK